MQSSNTEPTIIAYSTIAYSTMSILLGILSFPYISTDIMRRIFCIARPPALRRNLELNAVLERFWDWAQANQHLGPEYIRAQYTQLEGPPSTAYMRCEVADRHLTSVGY